MPIDKEDLINALLELVDREAQKRLMGKAERQEGPEDCVCGHQDAEHTREPMNVNRLGPCARCVCVRFTPESSEGKAARCVCGHRDAEHARDLMKVNRLGPCARCVCVRFTPESSEGKAARFATLIREARDDLDAVERHHGGKHRADPNVMRRLIDALDVVMAQRNLAMNEVKKLNGQLGELKGQFRELGTFCDRLLFSRRDAYQALKEAEVECSMPAAGAAAIARAMEHLLGEKEPKP